jgi:hypothetical protein
MSEAGRISQRRRLTRKGQGCREHHRESNKHPDTTNASLAGNNANPRALVRLPSA